MSNTGVKCPERQDSVRAMLRFLKPHPSDVDVLTRQGIPKLAPWKSIVG